MAIDIEKFLKEQGGMIDKVIEKYIPRKFTNDNMEFVCGKPRYEYNIEAPQKAVAEPIWDFLDRGGKRWRPVLFLLVAEALGGDPKKFLDFVVIPEVVHNGTLMHDDIEDNSDERRGKPCTYRIFGVDVAINAGHEMYYLPLLPLFKNRDKFDAETLLNVYEIYGQELLNLGMGQAMDIAWHKGIANADAVTEKQYLQMCAYKTGTLARMSAKIAAVLANADANTIETLGKFAESIGVAFQIQDDVLNLTETNGKNNFTDEQLGSDISEGKRTLMVIHTLQKADAKDRKRLIEILNMHTKERALKTEAIDIIKKYGAIEYAVAFEKKMIKDVWSEVDSLLKPGDAKEKLRAFAQFLVERDF
ncbi:MAG: polyprenyl synthetase family protein [Candidatus Aenigmatarchaeota archaeon]